MKQIFNNLRAILTRHKENLPVVTVAEMLAEIDGAETSTKMGSVSDGYHTFDELYHHRAILFSVICNQNKELAWKSKKHDTGDMYDGMFIVGIETPEGQATYHYDVEPYWNMFDIKELPFAPKWDGHTPDEAIRRISLLSETEAKHEKDCCEWKRVWDSEMILMRHKTGSYAMHESNLKDYPHCQVCGKKIKVVE